MHISTLHETEGFYRPSTKAMMASRIPCPSTRYRLIISTFNTTGGQLIDLNVFVPPDSGVVLEEADFINDQGEIIGYASLADGDEHGFILIPCDEHHPGVEGCDYSLVDAAEVLREIPASTMHQLTTKAPSVHRPFGRRGVTFPGQIGAPNAPGW